MIELDPRHVFGIAVSPRMDQALRRHPEITLLAGRIGTPTSTSYEATIPILVDRRMDESVVHAFYEKDLWLARVAEQQAWEAAPSLRPFLRCQDCKETFEPEPAFDGCHNLCCPGCGLWHDRIWFIELMGTRADNACR